MAEYDVFNNKYFPELDNILNTPIKSKYGILNVGLVKNHKVITGFQWNYSYWDGEKLKFIHSYDLRKLRLRVLELGYEWIITDNCLAIDSYKLNNDFLKKHEDYVRNRKKE